MSDPTQPGFPPPAQPYPAQPYPPQYPTQQYPPQQQQAPQQQQVPPQQIPPQQVPPQPFSQQQPYAQQQFPQQSTYGAYGQSMPPARSGPPTWLIVVIVVVLVGIIAGTAVTVVSISSGKKNTAGPSPTTTPIATSTGTTEPSAPPTTDLTPTTTPSAGSTPPATGNTQGLKLGSATVVSDDSGNSMNVTVNKISYRTTGCDTGDFNISDPDTGDAYVVIDVTYAVTKGVGSYNPFDWSVVDKAGNQSDNLAIFADCKPELDSSNNLHGTRRGLVVVEVKKNVTHGQAIYSTNLGETTASWGF